MERSRAEAVGPTPVDHVHTVQPAGEVDELDEAQRKKKILEANSLRDLLTDKERQIYDRVLRRIDEDDKWQSRPVLLSSALQEAVRNPQKNERDYLRDVQQQSNGAVLNDFNCTSGVQRQVELDGDFGVDEQGREDPESLYTRKQPSCASLSLANGEQESEDERNGSACLRPGWIHATFHQIGHALGSGFQLIGNQFEETATDEALDEGEFGNPRRRIRAMRRALAEARKQGHPPTPELPELHPKPPAAIWRMVMCLTAGALMSLLFGKKVNRPRIVLRASLLSVREGRRVPRILWPPGAWTRRSSTTETTAVQQQSHQAAPWQHQPEVEHGSDSLPSPGAFTLSPSPLSSPPVSGAGSASCSSTPLSDDGAFGNLAQGSGPIVEKKGSEGLSTFPPDDVSFEAQHYILNVLRGLPPPDT